MKVPKSLRRLALEVDGWLELDCAERALERMEPLMESPGARPTALGLRVRAMVALGRPREALDCLAELEHFEHNDDWYDMTEAWCRKRVGDLCGAIACMERLLERGKNSAIGHFNLGCYLALNGDSQRAIDEVSLACGIDAKFRTLAASDEDLASLRGDQEFQALLPPSTP